MEGVVGSKEAGDFVYLKNGMTVIVTYHLEIKFLANQRRLVDPLDVHFFEVAPVNVLIQIQKHL